MCMYVSPLADSMAHIKRAIALWTSNILHMTTGFGIQDIVDLLKTYSHN